MHMYTRTYLRRQGNACMYTSCIFRAAYPKCKILANELKWTTEVKSVWTPEAIQMSWRK